MNTVAEMRNRIHGNNIQNKSTLEDSVCELLGYINFNNPKYNGIAPVDTVIINLQKSLPIETDSVRIDLPAS